MAFTPIILHQFDKKFKRYTRKDSALRERVIKRANQENQETVAKEIAEGLLTNPHKDRYEVTARRKIVV